MRTVAVVGTSLAGLRAVEALRREGYDGRIVAVGAERHLPYDRPPLSKEFLSGRSDAADIVLRKQGVDDLDVEWMLGQPAVSLEVGARELTIADGARVAFDGLVLATGATPRRLDRGGLGHRYLRCVGLGAGTPQGLTSSAQTRLK